jgi:hypothetical protein
VPDTVAVSRNALCPCGSGKKFKRCCRPCRNPEGAEPAPASAPGEFVRLAGPSESTPATPPPYSYASPPFDPTPFFADIPRRGPLAGRPFFSWQQLVRLSDAELLAHDIADVNLACALGLPDAGDIDVERCRARLDAWTNYTRAFTDKALWRYHRDPADYYHSEGYARILILVTALQRDLGLRYNPAKIDPRAPFATADQFIHGALFGEGGTCASMPVIYASVGRRLGYPIRLVAAKGRNVGHLFNRWDDPKGERFNIEGTNQGLSRHSDVYYRTGRFRVTNKQLRRGHLLESRTPKQELADFLMERGLRFWDCGKRVRAFEAFQWALTLFPENRLIWNRLARDSTAWYLDLERRKPPRFPKLWFLLPPRIWPSELPVSGENDWFLLWATEMLLNDQELDQKWWGPLRRGECPKTLPNHAIVECQPQRLAIRYEYYQSFCLTNAFQGTRTGYQGIQA